MARAEWVAVNNRGLIWDRVLRGPDGITRVLGRIVFYTLRRADRASFWRAQRVAGLDLEPRSCLTLQEAIDWVEVEP